MSVGPYALGSDDWAGTSKLIEEMGELHQVLGKLIATDGDVAHWDGTNLRERMIEECGDVLAALQFFAGWNGFTGEMKERANHKLAVFTRWHYDQRI